MMGSNAVTLGRGMSSQSSTTNPVRTIGEWILTLSSKQRNTVISVKFKNQILVEAALARHFKHGNV
jgi:hypothetical protein